MKKKMIGKKIFFLIIIFISILFIRITVIADELLVNTFYLEIIDTKVEKGAGFDIFLKARSEKGQAILDKIDPDYDVSFEGISYSSINVCDNNVYTVILYTLGKKEISACIDYQGNSYYTDKIKIEVVTPDYENNDIFLISELSDQSVYHNQVVLHNINLYSLNKGIKYEWMRNGDFVNIYSETIESRESYEVFVYGRDMVKTVILSDVLQALNTGGEDYIIPASRITLPAEENNLEKEKVFDTGEFTLELIPLPEENKPDGFNGLVGSLEIKSEFDKNSISLDESIFLKVKLSGTCNLQGMDRIIYDEIPGFFVHQHSVHYKREIINGEYYNEKEFEVTLIPRNAGKYSFPEIKIDYFDPEKKDYKSVFIPALEIDINNHKQGNNDTVDSNMEIVIEQVFDGGKSRQLSDYEYFIFKKQYFYNLLIVILLLLSFFLIIKVCIKYCKNKKSGDELREIYRKIKKASDIDELYNLFNELIKIKYNISIKASERSIIKDKIRDNKLLAGVFRIMDCYEDKKEREVGKIRIDILNFYKERFNKN